MKKHWLRFALIGFAVLLVILIALPFLINVNSFRPKIESEASAALGRQVTVGNLSLSLFSGHVEADNIAIADDPAFSKSPFVTAQSLKIGVEMMPLIFSRKVNVTEIVLEQPQINLLRPPTGHGISPAWEDLLLRSPRSPRRASRLRRQTSQWANLT